MKISNEWHVEIVYHPGERPHPVGSFPSAEIANLNRNAGVLAFWHLSDDTEVNVVWEVRREKRA